MRKITTIIFVGLMIGCVSTQNTDKHFNLPVLVEQEVLPALPLIISNVSHKLEIKMQIDENGDVVQAHFLKGSGDEEWDSLAIYSIKKWKFEPARIDDKPVKMWIVHRANVKVEKPIFLSLAEIVCASHEKASSVFAQLKEGKSFGQLASEVSLGPSKNRLGALGRIDVNKFPQRVSSILKKLLVGQFTEPIEYNKQFIIFTRIEN